MKTTRKMKREAKRQYKPLNDMFTTMKHYFPDFISLLSSISDPRHQSYITYPQEELIMTTLFSHFSHVPSRKCMNICFNNDNVIKNFQVLFGFDHDEIPHGDTINNYFKNVEVDNFRKVIYKMLKDLVAKKIFEDYKIDGEYYQVIIDGVNMHVYHQKHIEGSIVKNHNEEKTTYHTDMLVAFVRLGNIVVPLDFEAIENIGIVYDKQDCEINAAKRMLRRIKKNFKRLKICISGDALYFGEPMIKMIEEFKWKYIFTFKEGCSKDTSEYFEACKKGKDTIVKRSIDSKEESRYEYYNGVEYRDNKLNMIEIEVKKNGKEAQRFCYATNIKITEKNFEEIAKTGRKRWKIENKGFNDLKNHGYYLEHAFSYDENAVKVHLAIVLISHLIMQLIEHYQRTKNRFETIRQLGEEIKEALRNEVLSAADIKLLTIPINISRVIPY